MITVVVGGSGSGKSEYAESLLTNCDNRKIYLATMQVFDDDGRAKVERHRRLRQGKGFETIEKTHSLSELIPELEKEESSMLLECMSNLVANEMFGTGEDKSGRPDEVSAKILKDISLIAPYLKDFVIVTNNVAEDGIEYDPSTMAYIKALSDVNVGLSDIADAVTEVVVGIPVKIKGGN